jgi:hypothetical protein
MGMFTYEELKDLLGLCDGILADLSTAEVVIYNAKTAISSKRLEILNEKDQRDLADVIQSDSNLDRCF